MPGKLQGTQLTLEHVLRFLCTPEEFGDPSHFAEQYAPSEHGGASTSTCGRPIMPPWHKMHRMLQVRLIRCCEGVGSEL